MPLQEIILDFRPADKILILNRSDKNSPQVSAVSRVSGCTKQQVEQRNRGEVSATVWRVVGGCHPPPTFIGVKTHRRAFAWSTAGYQKEKAECSGARPHYESGRAGGQCSKGLTAETTISIVLPCYFRCQF